MNDKIIESFAQDFANIEKWFQKEKSFEEISCLHNDLISLGQEYQKFFKNKWHYKTVKRIFVKYVACYLPENYWWDVNSALRHDILIKAKQGWIPLESARNLRLKRKVLKKRFLHLLLDRERLCSLQTLKAYKNYRKEFKGCWLYQRI